MTELCSRHSNWISSTKTRNDFICAQLATISQRRIFIHFLFSFRVNGESSAISAIYTALWPNVNELLALHLLGIEKLNDRKSFEEFPLKLCRVDIQNWLGSPFFFRSLGFVDTKFCSFIYFFHVKLMMIDQFLPFLLFFFFTDSPSMFVQLIIEEIHCVPLRLLRKR